MKCHVANACMQCVWCNGCNVYDVTAVMCNGWRWRTTDLANEHEKWLCENTEHGKSCVFVFDYPKAIKVCTAPYDLVLAWHCITSHRIAVVCPLYACDANSGQPSSPFVIITPLLVFCIVLYYSGFLHLSTNICTHAMCLLNNLILQMVWITLILLMYHMLCSLFTCETMMTKRRWHPLTSLYQVRKCSPTVMCGFD